MQYSVFTPSAPAPAPAVSLAHSNSFTPSFSAKGASQCFIPQSNMQSYEASSQHLMPQQAVNNRMLTHQFSFGAQNQAQGQPLYKQASFTRQNTVHYAPSYAHHNNQGYQPMFERGFPQNHGHQLQQFASPKKVQVNVNFKNLGKTLQLQNDNLNHSHQNGKRILNSYSKKADDFKPTNFVSTSATKDSRHAYNTVPAQGSLEAVLAGQTKKFAQEENIQAADDEDLFSQATQSTKNTETSPIMSDCPSDFENGIPSLKDTSRQSTQGAAKVDKTAIAEGDWKRKVKTELCKFWLAGQICENAGKEQGCGFAHGAFELQKKKGLNKQYLTSVCKNFIDHPSKCTYGHRCIFQHPSNDPRVRQPYTTTMRDNTKYTAMRLFQEIENADVFYINTYAATTPRLAVFKGICTQREEKPAAEPTAVATSDSKRFIAKSTAHCNNEAEQTCAPGAAKQSKKLLQDKFSNLTMAGSIQKSGYFGAPKGEEIAAY